MNGEDYSDLRQSAPGGIVGFLELGSISGHA